MIFHVENPALCTSFLFLQYLSLCLSAILCLVVVVIITSSLLILNHFKLIQQAMTCRASYVFWSKEQSFSVSCLLFRTLASMYILLIYCLSVCMSVCITAHTQMISISSLSLNLIYLLAYIVTALVSLSRLCRSES